MAAAPEKARRYRVTPGRLLPLLLAVEGLLWLSEHFHWMSKGWPVVTAIGTVAVFFVLMFLWFLAALVFRLRFQFSILSLLVLPVAVALPCGWLATEMKQARKQREAVEGIWKARGNIVYAYAMPPGPQWFRKLLGENLFAGT